MDRYFSLSSPVQSFFVPQRRADRGNASIQRFSSASAQSAVNPLKNTSNISVRSRSAQRRLTALPLPPGLALAADSDSGIFGDRRTTAAQVDLIGSTSPGATVTLQLTQAGISRRTVANRSGQFLFTNLPLSPGQNQVTTTARTQAGTRRFTTRFRRVRTDSTDVVLDWNHTLLRTLQLEQAGGLTGSRSLAMVHLAMFNAVDALTGTNAPLPASAMLAASVEAAAAAAAHTVLSQLYPDQSARLDAALTQSLLKIQQPESIEAEGVALGFRIGQQVLAQRQSDGSQTPVPDQATIRPGVWRPTPPRFQPAVGVSWGQVTPFVLTQGSQFRPGPPPRLTSRTYTQEFNQVKRLGRIDSLHRTDEQTQIARFWLGSPGSSTTSPGLWNEITAKAAVRAGQTLQQNARLFAQLNLALADAGIAAWDAKYTYRSWRPITAIRLAGSDGNPDTRADRNWQSLIETPAHPDYVSGHSTFAGAAAAVLTRQFGASPLTATSWDLPGVQRRFRSFQQAASEAGQSRIYGGIHTRSANRAGLGLGKQVGDQVLQSALWN